MFHVLGTPCLIPFWATELLQSHQHGKFKLDSDLVKEIQIFCKSDICYGGLNENVPHGLLYLNALSPVGGAVWGHLGGVDLEEIHHWEVGIAVSKSNPSQSMFPSSLSFYLSLLALSTSPASSICFMPGVQDLSSQLTSPAVLAATSCHVAVPSWALVL